MAETKRVQRIKLRCEGSPVKFDGTVIEASQDGKFIRVQFDGPIPDTSLYAFGDNKLTSHMLDKDGQPTTDVRMAAKCQWWEVIG